VETISILVCCTNAKLNWFGPFNEITRLVGDLGHLEQTHKSSLETKDQDLPFVMRWACLSLIVIQRILKGNRDWLMDGAPMDDMECAIDFLGALYAGDGQDRTRAQEIDENFTNAYHCLETLLCRLDLAEDFERETLEEVFISFEPQIAKLEQLYIQAKRYKLLD